MGQSTCTSRRGSRPKRRGRRLTTMSTVSSATRSGSSSANRKKSPRPLVRGGWPALMRWALVTTPLYWAWRNTWVRRTRGRTGACRPPAWSRSRRTSPGPTLGSWSTSPTSSRWAPEGTALTSLLASSRSSMEASSTTTRSASSGRSWLKAASPPGRSSSSRCRVWASIPASSDRRLAARPDGEALAAARAAGEHGHPLGQGEPDRRLLLGGEPAAGDPLQPGEGGRPVDLAEHGQSVGLLGRRAQAQQPGGQRDLGPVERDQVDRGHAVVEATDRHRVADHALL